MTQCHVICSSKCSPSLACHLTYLVSTIKRNPDLEVGFDLNGEPVGSTVYGGHQAGLPLAQPYSSTVMYSRLNPWKRPHRRTPSSRSGPTRHRRRDGGHVPGTNSTNNDEFTSSFWALLNSGDAATPLASRETLLAATEVHDRSPSPLRPHCARWLKRQANQDVELAQPCEDARLQRWQHLEPAARLWRHCRLHEVARNPRLAALLRSPRRRGSTQEGAPGFNTRCAR